MRTWRKTYAHLDEEQVTAELGDVAARAAHERRDPRRGCASTRASPTRPGRRSSSPARCWRSCSCRRPASGAIRAGPAFVVDERPRPDPADAATLVLRALPRRVRAGEQARRRLVVRRRAARLRGGVGAARARSPTATSTAASCSTSRTCRCRPRPRRCPCACSSRWDQPLLAYADRDRIVPPELLPLKLTLAGRRDGDRRRPRRGELARAARGQGRAPGDHAAHRDPPLGARRDPRGGAAHGALLRARRREPRGHRAHAQRHRNADTRRGGPHARTLHSCSRSPWPRRRPPPSRPASRAPARRSSSPAAQPASTSDSPTAGDGSLQLTGLQLAGRPPAVRLHVGRLPPDLRAGEPHGDLAGRGRRHAPGLEQQRSR